MAAVGSQFVLAAGFVTPAFVFAGVALASIPIIIHILNRRRFKTVPWAAMEFLLRALRQNRRRLRFEQWLLLAVRCALLALLGLALARPTGCEKSTLADIAARKTGLHVIVIDNSLSMGYQAARRDAGTHLEQAKLLAKNMLSRLSSGGESVAIVTASAPAKAVILKPVYDLEAARQAIDRIEQTAASSDIPGALRLVGEIGAAERQPGKLLYLFTDGTRSAWQGELARGIDTAMPELAKVFRVTHFNLGVPGQWNQSVSAVRPTSSLVRSGFDSDFLAVVRGFAGPGNTNVTWQVDGQTVLSQGATVASEGPPLVQSISKLGQGGVHVLNVTVQSDDRLPADNSRACVVEVASGMKVLIVEGSRGTGPLTGSGEFLATALAPPLDASSAAAGTPSSSYVSTELISDLELGNRALGDYRAIALAGVGSIQPTQADQLRRFVEQGGTLMLFMGEAVSGENYNQVLLPRGLLPGPLIKRVSSAADQDGYLLDFNPNGNLHPFLQVFRGVERSGLDTARVYDYWQVQPDEQRGAERVLSYLPAGALTPTTSPSQTGDPAITVHALGDGRVVFVSTTADAEWTSFPAKPNYATLMHELLAGSVQGADRWLNLVVGQPLIVPSWVRFTSAPLLRDAQQVELPLEATGAGYRSPPMTRPGAYQLSTGSRTLPVVVSASGEDSDIRVLDDRSLQLAMGGADVQFEKDELPPVSSNQDSGNDFGWSVMIGVLILVCAECFLAMKFGHYRRT